MASGNSKNSKVTRYPGRFHFNIGMAIFLIILIYVLISIFIYLNTEHIAGYEVMEGSLSSNNIYEAVALRTEVVVDSELSGYVNYFAGEGARVAVGNLVYTVDESGQLLEYLKSQGSEEVRLTEQDLEELRAQIVDYAAGFRREEFSTVYDFRNSLSGSVQKLSSSSILNNIQSLNADSATLQSINYCYAHDTGIVVYAIDGYEDVTLQNMTSERMDETRYDKHQLVSNQLVERGDPIYKLCTEENWSVVIQENDPEKVQELEDLKYVKIRFLKNQDEAWGKVSTYTNADGDSFVQFTFTNSMITFCRDRFLSIELITEEERGLKIPNSAISELNFYIVPKAYIITGNSGEQGVMRERYDENGAQSTEFVKTPIYNEGEDGCYVDMTALRGGDILIQPDSNSRYTVSRQASLIGVYNINKGYADFRQIKILYQNDEYAIVRPNTTYGLSVYDFIVLDAATVDRAKDE